MSAAVDIEKKRENYHITVAVTELRNFSNEY